MLTLVATISGKEVTTTYSTMSALKSYIASKRITAAVLSGKSESTTDTMYDLFASNLSYLTSLDLSGLDFSNITNTSSMLNGCNRLTSLVFPTNLDTSKVTNMSYMFSKCTGLTTIDVSKFNTSNVTNMSYMFNDCNLITTLNLSNFDTSKVTDMRYMFNNCYALQVDISNFDTSKVTDMRYMFNNCNNLSSFNATNLNLSSVKNMSYMFSNCTSLTSIDLSKLEAPKVTDISRIFNNCKIMTSAKLFKTTNTLIYINGLFSLCYMLKEFDITQLNTENVISMADMFSYCRGLVSLDLYYLNTQNVTSMYAMFKECNGISSLDISRFKTSKVTSTSYMFYRCYSLTEIDIQPLDLSNLTNTSYMFNSCSKLTTIYSKDFYTSKITNSTAMFTDSTKLKNYDSTKVDAQYANIETGYFTYKPSYTIPVISNIDMNTNEIKNQVVHNLKHAPENPVKGQIYFDTLTNKLYYFDGTDWTTTGVQTKIVDNLNSTSTTDALSANQGKVLNEKINDLNIPQVVDSLDSTDATKALSANQGKILNEKFNKKYSGVRSANYLFATKPLSPSSTNFGTLTLFVSNLDYYDKGMAGFVNIDRDGTIYVSTIAPTKRMLSSFTKNFWTFRDDTTIYCFVQVPNYNDNWYLEVLDKTGLYELQWTKYTDDEFRDFRQTHTTISLVNANNFLQGTIVGAFPTLLNSWTAYTSGANTLSRTNDIITLQLSVKNGTANTICQLPARYCPQNDAYFPINNLSDRAGSVFYITTDGYVRVESADLGKNLFANVSFVGRDL